jgi:hypothetical protein
MWLRLPPSTAGLVAIASVLARPHLYRLLSTTVALFMVLVTPKAQSIVHSIKVSGAPPDPLPVGACFLINARSSYRRFLGQ